jgi:hypothetical protein
LSRPYYGELSIGGVNTRPGTYPSLIKGPVWSGPVFGVLRVLMGGWVFE